MCSLILKKWNEALIDWVNCLSLTGRISDIEGLKNGEFFRLLLKKLTFSEELTTCASDCFDDIYSLLEKEFPLYGVREIGRDDSQLSFIASLLLLLSVTKEETPMFQANLCENLSHDSQVKIKFFLESCFESTNELNHSYLKTVIEGEAVAQEQTSTKVKDTISVKTPMKDFFDSPRQTNKLKRDLKRLETENETLLLEKLEIEDELRIEKEKKQRIEDALLQKTEQVLKLREELQDFIQTSNSKAEEDDISSQSESAIRSELRDLEKYVADLQDEKTALCEEKEKLMEKISTLQSKNKDFELQNVYAETKQQKLLAVLRERDEEVSTLRERCMELEEKINSLPSALNMSIESDTSFPLRTVSSPFGGERLSHAVVDVKLAEVEEENEKFKNQVKMLIDQRDVLTSQLKELREELDKEMKQGNDSRVKIESMRIDLEELRETCTSKEDALLELTDLSTEQTNQIHMMNSVIETGVAEKEQLKSNILSLNDHIQVLEETKEEILKENLQHKLQLSEHENTISDFKLQFEECQNILRKMAEEIENKSNLVEKLSSDIVDYKEQLKTVKEERDSIKENVCLIENDSHKLKETLLIKENLIASLRDSDTQKEEVVQILKKQVHEQINAIHSMEMAQKEAEAEKEQLEEEVEKIKNLIFEKERFAEKTKQDMDSKLNIIMGEMESLKKSYSLKEKTLKDLKNQLNEQASVIHSLEDNVKFLEEAKEKVAEENILYKSKINESKNKVSNLANQLEELNKNLECVRGDLFHKTCLADQLVLEKENYKENIEILKKEKENMNETLSLKDKSFEKMEKENERAIRELEKQLKERDLMMQSLQSTQTDLETKKNVLEKELETLNDQIQGAESLAEVRKQEIIDLRETLETLKEEKDNMEKTLSLKNESCLKMEEENEKAIQELRKQLRERDVMMQSLQSVQADLETKKNDLEKAVETLNDQMQGAESLAEVRKQEIIELRDTLETLKKEKDDMEETLSLKNESCLKLEEENEKAIQELQKQLKERILMMLSLQSAQTDLETKRSELEKEVRTLNDEIQGAESHAEVRKQEIIELRDTLETLKKEKDGMEETIIKKDKSYQKMKEENEKAIRELQCQLQERDLMMQSAKTDLETKRNEFEKEVETLNHQIQGAESLAEVRKQEIIELKDTLETLKNEKENMEENITMKDKSYQEMEEKSERAIQELQKQLKESDVMMQSLQSTQTNLETKRSELEMEVETLNDQIKGAESLAAVRMQEIIELKDSLETLKKEKYNMGEILSLKNKSCLKMEEENDNAIQELQKQLKERDVMMQSLQSVQTDLENKKNGLEKVVETLNDQIQAAQTLAEVRMLEMNELRENLETMKKDVDYASESNSLKEKSLQEFETKLREKDGLIKSLEDSREAVVTEKELLELNILHLKDTVKNLEETKEEISMEISHYKIQSLELSGRLSALEMNKELNEKHLLSLREELAEKNTLAEETKQKYKEEMEIMMEKCDFMKETISVKEKDNEELVEKIISKDNMIVSLEKDVHTKDIVIEELRGKLSELKILINSLESVKDSLEEGKKQFESELEQSNLRINEKDSVAEKAKQEIIQCRDKFEKMIAEMKDLEDTCSSKEKEMQEIKHQLSKCNDKIKSLEEAEVAMATDNKELESSILSFRAYVKLMEETKEEIMKENSHYKSQILDCGSKISDLETKLVEQERKLINFTDEISTKNNLVDRMEANLKDCYDEIETMKRERTSLEETISMKEKANEELKQRISNMEGTINSLEANKKGLMVEEKKLLCQVDEQKTTIKVLQQKLDSLSEEKIVLEEKLLWSIAQCEAFQKMLEETKIQGSVNKVELVNDEDAVKNKILGNGFENEFKIATFSENATSATVSSNLKDSAVQTSCDNKDKNSNLDGEHESFSSEYVGCLLDRTVDEEKLKQLDADKLMKLVNSWHDIDAKLEKLRLIECQLKARICSLWESIPRIQSKLKEKSNTADSSKITIEESDQAKEVIMRIISMVRSLEKHNSSLEKELVHASSNAVSWGLQGIQNQFDVVTSTPNSDHSNGDLNFKREQKDEFCSFLDTLGDKVSQVLEDVNSSVEIFKEVELRSANVAEALEYLKKNCLYEKEMLSDVDYEGFHIALTEEETKERFIKAMDEMELAKVDLERIACESRKEVENLQNEKENLQLELQSMAARCNLLESKLEMSGKHIELAVQETQQRIQKIYEKKLEATKEKWKTLYMDDLKTYEEECKLRKQFEESFKKYRSLAEDYEKKLAEATALNKDLKSKVQNLQGQKGCLEMKLRESRAKTFMEDEHRDSLDTGVYRSNYVDAMANYFARNNTSSPSSSMFDSQGDAHRDSISRSFSRESVQSSLPSGQVFCAEDEEGELFNATYLNDLSEGKCIVSSNRGARAETSCSVLRESNRQSVRNPSEDTPNRRMKELMRRNTLCLPHLKSSYPTETQFHDPKNFPEDLLKGNLSLKAPLLGDKQPRRLSGTLYGDLRRKKDIGQTTYMKPGPPTPGKNRRTSLQGSEQGSEQGKIPSTPGRFRTWFARGKRTVPNGDAENIPFTPRTKQKGLFQRAMANLERDGS